ncbi:GntR family transcriptional regulator [Paracoccus lutimaris]|uniref:GntR family transcriptional regulator n=1 Tax=Paracoccus lutimaris TaxID=1490030 RepID=A0A368Z3I4_9RHOB|nr:GntR family transcriptional regulator [Paracoccus lutimaris]RCW87005.1 GntR family transcriptional regulator [Paracoccus lutimaris]
MRRILPIPPIKSVADQVRDGLRAAIIDGQFAMGENISEERLTALFGVSRSPIRDALNALKFAGLVEIVPKRGSFVFLPGDAEVADLCAFRLMMEREAATLAMAAAPDLLVARLKAICARMARAEEDSDHADYAHADTAYHAAFFEFCGNPLVCDAYALADARIATLRTALTAPSDRHRADSFREHLAMAEQLGRGDLDGFRATLSEHINRTRRIATRELQRFKTKADAAAAR